MNFFKRLTNLFSEKTIIVSGNTKVRHFQIRGIHYIVLFSVFAVMFFYFAATTIKVVSKEHGLEKLYQEKIELEKINEKLTHEINVLGVQIGEVNNYLSVLGKDVDKKHEHINSHAKELPIENKDSFKKRYKNENDFSFIKTSMSTVLEQINDRNNYLIRIAKHILPNGSVAKTKPASLNDYDNNVEDFNVYKASFSNNIQNAIKVEKDITYLPILQPLGNYRITGNFGNRMHPVTHKIELHKGIDIAIKEGAPVYAAGSGVIKFAGMQRGYGNIVEIVHKDGVLTKYAHLAATKVKKGQRVKIGDTIGTQGHTGSRCAGSHLHYEVLVAGKNQNPHQFISAQNYVKRQTASK